MIFKKTGLFLGFIWAIIMPFVAYTNQNVRSQVTVLVVRCGNMGTSHAMAYRQNPNFKIVGLVNRGDLNKNKLLEKLNLKIPLFSDFNTALKTTKPDAVSINTYTQTHASYVIKALSSGAHVFVEKPLAETIKQAQLLGKPLVMRMNSNQQSSDAEWEIHKKLMNSVSPIVDCGVHYVDIMSQMTQSNPIKVHAIGARLSDELKPDMYNYGQLQVEFADGSVGWYEAGWGPMMSETAHFIKDVIGPKGSVSLVPQTTQIQRASADLESHTDADKLILHYKNKKDETIQLSEEISHQSLCDKEQAYFLKAIQEDLDLSDHHQDVINSMKIVMAADQSIKQSKVIEIRAIE